ncbi:MAG: Glucosamine-phosphate N-acetyltransferase [Bacteroidetes bacterium]|nr:Glucosamine-phosphate N-acetyltransferase [Bacteroidota bacterium]
MQAIIPVAGAGTRLRPLTYTQPKVLISVAGKPILSYIIENLIENGITDFVFVIGYLGEKIREYVEKNYPILKVSFVTQEERSGLGHAIWTAKDQVDLDKPLIIQLGDTILDADFKAILSSEYSTLCIKKVEDPRAFGVAELDSEGFIKNLVEKPLIPKSNMALVGFYFIRDTKALFHALEGNVKNNERTDNEYYLTNGLQKMINEGVKFKSYKVEHWFDVGKKDILLETNSILLRKNGDRSCDNCVKDNTIFISPYHISNGAKIKNSVIGPYVTIGENSEINNCLIKNSVIGSFSRLENVTLHSSLIGSDTTIKGNSQSLNIGDNTEIDLRGESH